MAKRVAHRIEFEIDRPGSNGSTFYTTKYLCGKFEKTMTCKDDPPRNVEPTEEQLRNFPPTCKKCEKAWQRKLPADSLTDNGVSE